MTPEAFLAWAALFPEPLFLVTGQGTILAGNDPAGALVGRGRAVLAGTPLADLVTTPPAQVAAYLRACARTRTLLFGALTFRTPGGVQACRAEGARLQATPADAPAVLLLRCRPRQETRAPFVQLNEHLRALTSAHRQLLEAHARLHAQRELFECTLTSIGDAVIATDPQGRVTLMNPTAEVLTGWPAPEARGRDLAEVFRIVNLDTRQPVENPVTTVLREGRVVGLANHTLLIARDGTERPIDDSGAPVRTPAGALLGVVLVFRDVTARQQAAAELTHRRREADLLAAIAQELGASLDLDTVLQRVVTGAWELCGSERALIALREPGTDVLVGRYEVGAPHVGYAGLRLAPGTGIGGHVLRTGRPWRTADYAIDPHMSPAYRAGARAGGHIAVVAVPILMAGRAEGVLYVSNPVAQPFTAQDEMLLVRLAAHAGLALRNAQLYQQAQAELAERRTAEAALAQAKSDLERRVAERTAALQHEMAARQRLAREAQRAEHFALLGRLAAGVSHELRNPLGAVFLNVDLLAEELRELLPDGAAGVAESLAEIKAHLARVEDLVEDYLSLVRVGAMERPVQDLGQALRGWAAEFQALATAQGMTVRAEGLATLGAVAFHASTLRRALLNLVQNGLEAMAPGGTLTLRGHATATHIALQVADTGSGILADRLQQIFEPLHTTKPGGTGLGLYIVQEVVQAHGGRVTVQSTVGQGTTFTLTLPRATPPLA